jgi:signal transduction histidine kinase
MPSGGTFTVSIEPLGADWQLSFADSGTGMSPQQIEKIFEPFQSTFEGGTGLGLAIVYQIVQAHEGKVWARSRQGQGTALVLKLRRLETESTLSLMLGNVAGRQPQTGLPTELECVAAPGRARG